MFSMYNTLVPEAIYKERGAMERGRGAKRGRGKIASGRNRWKSHFHAKPSTEIGARREARERKNRLW